MTWKVYRIKLECPGRKHNALNHYTNTAQSLRCSQVLNELKKSKVPFERNVQWNTYKTDKRKIIRANKKVAIVIEYKSSLSLLQTFGMIIGIPMEWLVKYSISYTLSKPIMFISQWLSIHGFSSLLELSLSPPCFHYTPVISRIQLRYPVTRV